MGPAPLLVIACGLFASPSIDRVASEVNAKVSADLSRVDVRVTTRLTPRTKLEKIPIILAAERYRTTPPHISPQLRQIYPVDESRGGFDTVTVRVDGRECRTTRYDLADGSGVLECAADIQAGQTVTVEMSTTLTVPKRFGAFGRVDRSLTLAGGWYPYVAEPGEVAPRGEHRAGVSIPAKMVAVLGESWFPLRSVVGRRRVEAVLNDVTQVALVLRPASYRPMSVAGGRVRFLSGPGAAVQERENWTTETEQMVEGLEDGVEHWRSEMSGTPDRARPLIVVRTPLRHNLAQAVEGMVLVSDRAFRLVPFDRFLRFHRFPILRECFQLLADRNLSSLGGEERVLAADALGAFVNDRYVAARFGEKEDAFDVLSPFAFIPSIDSMLYAPDLAFIESYFRLIKEDDPLRDDFIGFPTSAPRGKLLYEKLRDRVGPKGTANVLGPVLQGRAGFFEGIRAALGDDAAQFLKTWRGAYPDVNYALSDFGSRPRPDLCPSCVEAFAVVERQGDVVAEPVQVAFHDEDDNERVVVAPASKEVLRTVTATLSAPLDLIEVDPRSRLAEAPTDELPAPRFDNRSEAYWRWLLNSWNLSIAATAGQLNTAVDVGFARRYDATWSFALRADFRPDIISGTVRGRYGFGAPVTPNSRSQWLGLALTSGYLRPGFADQVEDGAAIAATAYYGFDNRVSAWAPETATGVRFALEYNRVLGTPPGDSTNDAAAISARFLQQLRIGARNMLSARLTYGWYFAGRPRRQLLFGIGGRRNMRGYNVEDAVGRVRGVASLEWLHPVMPRFEVNGFFLAWVNGIDGALFGDVGVISDEIDTLFDGPVLGDVGYGLRLYLDYGGVRPGVLAVDIAFPLVRAPGMAEFGPPAVYIDFTQSFAAF